MKLRSEQEVIFECTLASLVRAAKEECPVAA